MHTHLPKVAVVTCLWSILALILGLGGQLASANPDLPIISNQTFAVTNAAYGAVGNGTANNAAAIQSAISDASSHGGGTVLIPANGTLSSYLSGPITLANGINFQVDSNATLKMLPFGSYPTNGTIPNFIAGSSLHDVELSGYGTIDGQATTAKPGWWDGRATSLRPLMISLSGCQRVLIQNLHLKNPPKMHIGFGGTGDNITIQGITINTPSSPNTDGIDLAGTNCLVQNCSISDGDDNIAFSPTSGTIDANILVTNCVFGIGHGVSIGSNTAGGLSNLTVTSCSYDGTDYGIRMKSDNNTTNLSLNGRGGTAQDLTYSNLTMTNIQKGAIVIYSYYNEVGTPTSVTPATAAGESVGTTNIPVWRNITISNVTASVASGAIPGIIWGRLEMTVSNLTLASVSLTGATAFDIYNARAMRIVDAQFNISGANALELYNAEVTITNSVLNTNVVSLDGLATSLTNNVLAFFNASARMAHTNALGPAPFLTLSASTLTVSTNLNLGSASVLNFGLGTNATKIAVTGNLALRGTLNTTDDGGLTNGTYTLFTYSGTLTSSTLMIGSVPNANFTYTIATNTSGQVNLVVAAPPDPFTSWQLQYFGCTNLALCPQADGNADPLGKGMSNTNQFLAGLNPTNPASLFQITSVVNSGADVWVTWSTAGGHTNIVQVTGGDTNGGYVTNGFADIPASQTILPGSSDTATNFVDSGGATNVPSRYYRVRLVP
ncbi:MAG TPA: glycosyl hydrolase family 28 protein [Verrucomicrobiae bacterium]|nr:glycosyl hydrolase family 28 protein [Verrucomicrobiae bacterium]